MKPHLQPVVEWLGTTPHGWAQPRLKAIFRDNTGTISIEQLADLEVQHYSIPNFDEFAAPAREDGATIASNKTLLRGGEILYSKLNCHKPRVWLVPHDDQVKVASTEFVPLVEWQSGSVNKRFIAYLIGSAVFAEYMTCFQTSVTNSHRRINPNDLWQTRVPLPPLPEQQRIVAYLDASCAAIDTAVSAKRRQLDALDALRKVTIHTAVTQGLNPDVKMRHAGLDWLSEAPSHWTPSRIKNVAKLSPGFSGKPPTNYEECAFIPMESLSNAGSIDTSSVQTFEDMSGGFTMFEVGDVLFAKITPCMENGKGAFVETLPSRYAFGSTEFHVLRPSYAINGKFLYYYTYNSIFRAWAAENMSGAAGQKRVSSRFLKETRLFVPPLPEQIKIIAFLTVKEKEFRALFRQIESQIATLTAYRKSLIHECVTGQRRVTEADVARVKTNDNAER